MNPTPKLSEADLAKVPPAMDEADIGSGEKSPGEQETDEMIRQIPPLPHPSKPAAPGESAPTDQPSR